MKNDQDPIWPSYADLMTSLFGVALVLFVLSYWLVTVKYKLSAEKWDKIQEIEESVAQLADEKYFAYQERFKRHVFRQEVQFEVGQAIILPEFVPFLEEAGQNIARLVEGLRTKATANIKYIIIIEGMASRDGFPYNFDLSYQRALALYRLWQKAGIAFDPNICEVIVAGSGEEGVGRYVGADEKKNQRFLIQIIPKVGSWDVEAPAPAAQAVLR